MERVDSVQRLSALLAPQLRPGVRTNSAMSAEDHRREIAAGALYACPLEAGLLLLRRRAGHWLLHYYLPPEAEPFSLSVAEPVVTEVVLRPKDAAGAGPLLALLRASGLEERLRRLRLERPAGPVAPVDSGFLLRPAGAEEAPAVGRLLAESLDPLTGCLPAPEELAAACAGGEVLCALDGAGALAGALHSRRGRAAAEVRHLAVRAEARGRRCGQSLLARWLDGGEGRARAWTGMDNAAALGAYARVGFAPDGWQSVVLADLLP